VLHGANVVAKGSPYLPSDAGFGSDDAEYLVSEGFNTIRYGVDYAAIEPTPDGYDTAFLQALAAEAEAVGRSGLFVLADVHQDMDDRLLGGPGDDRLKGGPGRDRLKCGKGRDLALAGRGDSVHASCEKVRRGKK
jgi:Ca2+-binding RTX toxin-like protein